jgi:hypothetical protein
VSGVIVDVEWSWRRGEKRGLKIGVELPGVGVVHNRSCPSPILDLVLKPY